MNETEARDIQKAGTGFMMDMTEGLHRLQEMGYTENLSARFDHFECRSGQIRLNPEDFVVDENVRFENTSDPDDQAIAYAVRSPETGIKGVYIESYGIYHDDLSPEMIEKLKIAATF